MLVAQRRNAAMARALFARALRQAAMPVEVTTDKAPVYPGVIDEVLPAALHIAERYATVTTLSKLSSAGSNNGRDRCED